MTHDAEPSEGKFEALLRREVERVLADPSFQRSPVQSRLLGYLCEQTVACNRDISQRAVAIDGLGRNATVGPLTESYPRVQVSRLRSNLSHYYDQCAPGEGLAIYIGLGDYQLRLASPERAYRARRPRTVNRTPLEHAADKGRWSRPALLAALFFALAALASLWLVVR